MISKGSDPLLEDFCDGIFSGVLNVFEAVAHQLGATKPAGDTNDRIGDVLLLHNAQDDHARSCFSVVVFGFKNGSFVGDSGRPSIVSGFLVFFVLFKGFEKVFDIFPAFHSTYTDRVLTTSVFNNLFIQNKRLARLTSITKIKLGGLLRHLYSFVL